MTQQSPALTHIRQYPQGGIGLPVAFPREPEPNNKKCQTLRHNPRDLDPEDHGAPVIVAAVTTTTATETETAATGEAAVANNKAAAPNPAAAPLASPSPFR